MQSIQEAKGVSRQLGPEKILQFGEGNFIRAFADWMIHLANQEGHYDGSVVMVQPIQQGLSEVINQQQGLYTVLIRDQVEGRKREEAQVVECVSRCIDPYLDYGKLVEVACSGDLEVVLSNTTEQGIAFVPEDKLEDAPPSSFPGKLTALLYRRYCHFQGDPGKGLLLLPLELINGNGAALREAILQYTKHWALSDGFKEWFLQHNPMATTLVDRIVTGYPKAEAAQLEEKLGYTDKLLDTCESYHLLAIQGPQEWSAILPIHKTKANVIWAEDITPYRTRKLYILNGAHNAFGLAAYLAGYKYVIDVKGDPLFERFLQKVVYGEIVSNFTEEQPLAKEFADQVLERFANPYIRHDLLQIAIHGCAKFRVRCLPSIKAYMERTGEAPEGLVFAFAAFLFFYKGRQTAQGYVGTLANKEEYPIRDAAEVQAFFADAWADGNPAKAAARVLSHRAFWDGEDLCQLSGLQGRVTYWLQAMLAKGVEKTLEELVR